MMFVASISIVISLYCDGALTGARTGPDLRM
jgi:hypothetical protein